MILALLILAAALRGGQFPVDGNGWIIKGLPAAQDNLLGPLIPMGASPWVYGDIMERAVADHMATAALAETPVLGTALPGTVSWATSGGSPVTTTADLRTYLVGQAYIIFAWTTVDGAGTGRLVCTPGVVTSTTITCTNHYVISTIAASGVTAYLISSTPGPSTFTFLGWAPQDGGGVGTTWNYYDVAIGLYRLYYRTGTTAYLTNARAYADIQWQWTLDHGYSTPAPRVTAMGSQFFRALDGHPERFPGLYAEVTTLVSGFAYVDPNANMDNREAGYTLWDVALGAKTDSDPTRHAQYCSWLATYTGDWNAVQYADGSFGENEYAINSSYVSAPQSFTLPIKYQAAPWRLAINVKSLEAAYESLNDTTAQGCNQTAIAATTLTTITNAVAWQHNTGRDSVDRGSYYEVNSQSADEASVYHFGTIDGTVDINLTSTSLTGHSTNWQTAGYCDGTHFIGINTPRTIYKIASCTSDTAATITPAFGFYTELANVSASPIAYAPAMGVGCNSSATNCFGSTGDRNLTRTICGGTGWLYAQTLNPTYLAWADECTSATLGGPTAGPTGADTVGSASLPCSGPACDGIINDTGVAMANCSTTGAVPPCQWYTDIPHNLGKNFGEAFGAPGIDNELAWRLLPPTGLTCDLNHDGAVNVLDVQLMINQVLGITTCTNDLTLTGSCNVVDVQRVVNALLGGPCRIGP